MSCGQHAPLISTVLGEGTWTRGESWPMTQNQKPLLLNVSLIIMNKIQWLNMNRVDFVQLESKPNAILHHTFKTMVINDAWPWFVIQGVIGKHSFSFKMIPCFKVGLPFYRNTLYNLSTCISCCPYKYRFDWPIWHQGHCESLLNKLQF